MCTSKMVTMAKTVVSGQTVVVERQVHMQLSALMQSVSHDTVPGGLSNLWNIAM